MVWTMRRMLSAVGTNEGIELLLNPEDMQKIWILRKLLHQMDEMEASEFLLDKIRATKNNADFFDSMRRG